MVAMFLQNPIKANAIAIMHFVTIPCTRSTSDRYIIIALAQMK